MPTRTGSRPTTSTRSTSPRADRIARLAELSERLLAADGVDHVDASLAHVLENKFYADTAGTMTTQQRVRIHPAFTAVHVDRGEGKFYSMRTVAAPAGRGWEYLTGTGWDVDAEIAELPELLAEHVKAPSVEPGAYDLVIDPTNLWLTIHESIGHATELDRALGYEAAYAGTSFATLDQLGTLQYGSPIMNVTGDRTVEHGLATIGYDDEGVADVAVRHRAGRAAGRLPAQPADGPGQRVRAARTGARSPTRPATSRCSGWRTCRWRPTRPGRRSRS